MRKNLFSFSKLILAGTLIVGMMSTVFVGCKNYDDDIAKSNESIAKLQTQVSSLETAVASAQSAATTAKSAADAAKAEAVSAASAAASAKTEATAAAAAAAEAKAQSAIAVAAVDKAKSEAMAEAKKLADEALAAALANDAKVEELVNQLDSKLAVLQDQVNTQGSDLLKLQEAVKLQQSALTAFQKEYADFQVEYAAFQKQFADFQTSYAKDQEALKKALQEAGVALQKSLTDINSAIAANATDIATLKSDLAKVNGTISSVNGNLSALSTVLGKRLTSMVFVPSTYIDGIPAIIFQSAKYTAKEFNAAKEVVAKAGIAPFLVSTKTTEVDYRLNPTGVNATSIENFTFDTKTATNFTRAAQNPTIGVVANQAPYSIENGYLKLKVEKIGTGNFNTTETNFLIASLKAQIASNFLFEGETEAYVNADYVRVTENTVEPRIAKKEFVAADADSHYYAYADLKSTNQNEKVSYKFKYDTEGGIDLKPLAQVCYDIDEHKGLLANYKDYGFAFRFYVDETPYYQTENTQKTNQQEFATIADAAEGIMTSKVYTVNGVNMAAVNREPIIRIELIDTNNNNNLIDSRFMKIKWTKDDLKPIPLTYAFEAQALPCADLVLLLGTKEMNEQIYAKMNNGAGMARAEFHRIYTKLSYTGVGTVEDIEDAQEGTGSHNLKWTLTPEQIGTILPERSKDFQVVAVYKDIEGVHADVQITITVKIVLPELGIKGYNQTYWFDNENSIFRVNPLVYGATGSGVKSLISTDLLNGFATATSVKPASLRDAISGLTECSTAYFEFIESAINGRIYTPDALLGNKVLNYNATAIANITNDATSNKIELDPYAGKVVFDDITKQTNDVKVRIYADYNAYNTRDIVKEYTVRFIRPLTIKASASGYFEDALINGSHVAVDQALAYTDWRGYLVQSDISYITNPTEFQKYAVALFNYYGVNEGIWDTDNAKTNLKFVGNKWVPTEGVTDGPLPANASLTYDSAKKELIYVNNAGSYVEADYMIYAPVKASYLWGEVTENVAIPVKYVAPKNAPVK